MRIFPLKKFIRHFLVEIVKKDNGYQLLRGGEPYYVKGVGGLEYLEKAKEYGANSFSSRLHFILKILFIPYLIIIFLIRLVVHVNEDNVGGQNPQLKRTGKMKQKNASTTKFSREFNKVLFWAYLLVQIL
ncbi:hypothetical protein N9Y89_00135 [bacterium]|nr:hypothetical protein [bacterium]